MFGEKSLEQSELKFKFEADKDGFVKFRDVSRKLFNQQCQYGSRYFGGWEKDGYPNLSEGLRVQGKPDDYHN